MAEQVRKKSLTASIASITGSIRSRKKSVTSNTGTPEPKTETPETETKPETIPEEKVAEKPRKKSLTVSLAGSIRSLRKKSVTASTGTPEVITETPEADTNGEANAETVEATEVAAANAEAGGVVTTTQGESTEPTEVNTAVPEASTETPEDNAGTPGVITGTAEPPNTSPTEEVDAGVEAVELPKERQPIAFGGRSSHIKDRFRCVSGVAVSKDSEIYLADCYNERIVIYSPEGKFIRQFQTAMKGLFKRKPFQPQDVAIDKYENVWVVGSFAVTPKLGARDYVVQFSKDGNLIGKPIEMPHTGTNFHGIAAKPNNLFHKEVVVTEDDSDLPPKPDMEIIVTEQRVRPWEGKWYVESCAKVFLPDGTMYKTVAGRTRKARYAAVNSKGDIIVTDCWTHRVHTFKDEDKPAKFGRKGNQNGCLEAPHGVCTDSEDNIIVVDRDNRRVELFDKDGNFIRHIAEGMADPWAVAAGPDFLVVTNVGKCGVDTVTVIPYKPPHASEEE